MSAFSELIVLVWRSGTLKKLRIGRSLAGVQPNLMCNVCDWMLYTSQGQVVVVAGGGGRWRRHGAGRGRLGRAAVGRRAARPGRQDPPVRRGEARQAGRALTAPRCSKEMLREDRRRLQLYQEAYLPDGDAHADSDLLRRFRWRTAGQWPPMFIAAGKTTGADDLLRLDGEQADAAASSADPELPTPDDEALESWRAIQQERAQFLAEKVPSFVAPSQLIRAVQGLEPEHLEERSVDAEVDTLTLFKASRINIRRSTSFLQSIFSARCNLLIFPAFSLVCVPRPHIR